MIGSTRSWKNEKKCCLSSRKSAPVPAADLNMPPLCWSTPPFCFFYPVSIYDFSTHQQVEKPFWELGSYFSILWLLTKLVLLALRVQSQFWASTHWTETDSTLSISQTRTLLVTFCFRNPLIQTITITSHHITTIYSIPIQGTRLNEQCFISSSNRKNKMEKNEWIDWHKFY